MPQAVGRHRRRGIGSDYRRCGVFGGKCVPLTSSRASNLVFPCQLALERNSAYIFSDLSSSSYSVNTDSVSKYNTYIHTYIHTHTCVHTYMHTYIRTYINICIHTYIHKYMHTYVHTYIDLRLGSKPYGSDERRP